MKRTRNGILIPDVPIMAGGNLPNAVKGMSSGSGGELDPYDLSTPFFLQNIGNDEFEFSSKRHPFEISYDGKNWENVPQNNSMIIPHNGRLYLRGDNDFTLYNNTYYWNVVRSSELKIGGNLNSLIHKENYDSRGLENKKFKYALGALPIIDATYLVLPAATLESQCYMGLFNGCTSLVNAPELPAETLADKCYYQLFSGCTSLVNAPELPAKTLADSCYQTMFANCASLVNAPELPAEILVENCYRSMFQNCSVLQSIKIDAIDISATLALDSWLSNVSNSGTFIKKRNVDYPSGTNGIPTGWTVEEID